MQGVLTILRGFLLHAHHCLLSVSFLSPLNLLLLLLVAQMCRHLLLVWMRVRLLLCLWRQQAHPARW
jgi:hypothetical protein